MTDELAIAHHVNIHLRTRQVVCTSVAQRRHAARILFEVGDRHGLLVFRIADNHIHAVLACSREDAGRFARAVGTRLRWALGLKTPFEPTWYERIESQRHLYNAFWYVLRQERHHATAMDPCHDASSLPDLVGARVLHPRRCRRPSGGPGGRPPVGHSAGGAPAGGAPARGAPAGGTQPLGAATAQRVATLLPRIGRRALLDELRVGDLARPVSLDGLGAAAAAAVGIASLDGRGVTRSIARHAATHVAAETLSMAAIARQLAISPRAVFAWRKLPPDDALLRAIDLQLRMRELAFTTALDGSTRVQDGAPPPRAEPPQQDGPADAPRIGPECRRARQTVKSGPRSPENLDPDFTFTDDRELQTRQAAATRAPPRAPLTTARRCPRAPRTRMPDGTPPGGAPAR